MTGTFYFDVGKAGKLFYLRAYSDIPSPGDYRYRDNISPTYLSYQYGYWLIHEKKMLVFYVHIFYVFGDECEFP